MLSAITALVWRFRKKRVFAGGMAYWYLGTMVPVIGIVQVGRQAMADRYAYIPFIGLFVIASSGWSLICLSLVRVSRDFVAAIAITLAILSGYAAASSIQIGYWRNSITLFAHALQVTTDNGIAEDNLGAALMDAGRPDLGFAALRGRGVRLVPQLSTPHYNLATVLHRQESIGCRDA